MANPYFTKTGNPANHSSGSSSLIRAEIASIEGGFDAVDTAITALESTDTSLQAQVNKKPAKNFILNGRFNVQQDIQSIIGAVNGDYIGDVWYFGKAGTTATYNLGVGTPGSMPAVADAGELLINAGIVRCSGVDAAVAAGDYVFIKNDIEGYDWRNLAQRDLKLGFWAYSTKAGIFCVSLRNGVSNRSYVAEYTINAPNTWEFKETTIPASPAAGTWDYTNGVGCQVTWTLMAGTTYHTAAGAWQTGNYLATSNQVNFSDNTNNYFYITGVKLSAETTYSSIEPEDYQQELARVRRYYRFVSSRLMAHSTGLGNTAVRIGHVFDEPMRAAPTVTFGSVTSTTLPLDGKVTNVDGSDYTTGGNSTTKDGIQSCTRPAGTAATLLYMFGAYEADARF
jgi:hypothetical protein